MDAEKNVVKDCSFCGVKFDEPATAAVLKIAEALLENASALHGLVSVLTASNVHIDTLLKIGGTTQE